MLYMAPDIDVPLFTYPLVRRKVGAFRVGIG